MPDAISAYLQELKRSRKLSREEELSLWLRSREGDQEALTVLMLSVRPWAFNIVKKRVFDLPTASSLADEACMRAMKLFNPAKGRLTTYVSWWAFNISNRFARTQSTAITVPVATFTDATREFSRRARGAYSIDETRAGTSGGSSWSMHDLLSQGTSVLDEVIENEEDNERKARERYLQFLLDQLEPRDRQIMIGRKTQTLLQVGKGLGITRERVRQLEMRAMAQLCWLGKKYPYRYADFKEKEECMPESPSSFPVLPPVAGGPPPAPDLLTMLEQVTLQQVDREIDKCNHELEAAKTVHHGRLAQLHVIRKAVVARTAAVTPPQARSGTTVAGIFNVTKRKKRNGRPTNASLVVEYLFSNGPATTTAVAKATGIPVKSASAVLTNRRDLFCHNTDGYSLTPALRKQLAAEQGATDAA